MKLSVWPKALLCVFGITMKLNPDKFYLLLSDKRIHQVYICNENLSSTGGKKFLGINIGNKLTFADHVERLCKKAS